MRRLISTAVAALALTAGCTFEPGVPFATLTPAPLLRARVETPPDRATDDGYARLSSDYQIRIIRAEIDLERIELVAASAGDAAFDPARPPAGYSLCHNGHCHHESGRLVPYDEIGVAGETATVVVALPVGALDLASNEVRALECDPSCDLPGQDIGRMQAPIGRVFIEGFVRDARTPARLTTAVPFRYAAAYTDDKFIHGPLDLPVDGRHDPAIELLITAALDPAAFDGIDWAASPRLDGAIDLARRADVALIDVELREHLTLRPDITRRPF